MLPHQTLSHTLLAEQRQRHRRRSVSRPDTIDMDPLGSAIDGRGAGKIDDRAFGRAVGARMPAADEAEDGGDVDDPAAIAGGVRWLGEHLFRGVFGAVEDA